MLERANAFKAALSSRLFLAVAISTAVAYLSFFKYLDIVARAQPMADTSYFLLFYPVAGLSSVLMGLNVYSFRFKLSARQMAGRANVASGSAATGMSLFGGVISCFCHATLLMPLLSFAGLSAFSGIGLITPLVESQVWVLSVFVVVDLFLIYYTLGRLQTSVR